MKQSTFLCLCHIFTQQVLDSSINRQDTSKLRLRFTVPVGVAASSSSTTLGKAESQAYNPLLTITLLQLKLNNNIIVVIF